jgi:hypothetical protein
VIGVGSFIIARRSKRAWSPSEAHPKQCYFGGSTTGRVQVTQDLKRFPVVSALLECIPCSRVSYSSDRLLVCNWVYFPDRNGRLSARLGGPGRGIC